MIRYFLIFMLMVNLMVSTVGAVDKYPSMNVFKVGNRYDNVDSMKASVNFYGANMDVVLNGSGHEFINGTRWFDSLKVEASTASRTIETYPYANFQYWLICDDTLSDTLAGGINVPWMRTMREVDAQSGIRESMYIHYGDDSIMQTMSASGNSCPGHTTDLTRGNVPGWGPTYRLAQGNTWWNESGDWAFPAGRIGVYNPLYSKFGSIRSEAFLTIWGDPVTWIGLDSAIDGFYMDNCYIGAAYGGGAYWGNDSSKGGATGPAGWSILNDNVDFLEFDGPGTNDAVYYGHFTDAYKVGGSTAVANGFNYVGNFATTSSTYLDELTILSGNVVSHVFFETRLGDLIIKRWSQIQGDLSRQDACIAYPGLKNYWECRPLSDQPDDTGYSFFAHSAFAAFCVIQDTASSYFCYSGFGNGTGDTLYWTNFDLFQVDLGEPKGPTRTLVDTGTTTGAESVHFLYREYENGYAYGLPKEADGSDTTASNTYDYDLGADTGLYVLGDSEPGHASDSTYKANGTITIRPGHWGIALKKAGATENIFDGINLKGVTVP